MPRFLGQLGVRHQRGFSLVEALFSALILAVALLGLAGFHAAAMQDGSLVKARSVAASLAQEKLDDLRSFTRLEDDATTTSANECADPTFCFSEIADNAGGSEDGGSLLLPSGTVSGYTDSYSLQWKVICAAETPGSALSFSSTCTDATAKLATVTVSWIDSKRGKQSVELQGVIYAMDPARMAMGAASTFSTQKPGAVAFTPGGGGDNVSVPIDTGGSQFKESSKPLPEVSQSGDGINVSFDSVIYSRDGAGYQKDSQEEFSNVTCECQFNSGTGTGYTATRKVWNGSRLLNQTGEAVAKKTGQPLGNNPPSQCDVCCRDHHDRAGNDPKYDPKRPASDYTGDGNHKHYWYSNSNCVSGGVGAANCTDAQKDASLASGSPFTEVTDGAYLESCRVARVDGFWRVMQDWQLRKVTILPYNFLLNNSTNLDLYVDVVEKVVENAVKTDSGGSVVAVPTLGGRDLTLPSGSDPVQLLSRAVYVDTIYNAEDDPATSTVNEQNTLDTAYYNALLAKIAASQTASNSGWLEFAPFYEANLTLLFDWTSSDTSVATVTSEAINAIVDPLNNYYGSFSRGKVTVQSGTTAGTSTITVKARLSNSGVTGGVNVNVNPQSPTYVPGVSYGTDAHDNLGTEVLTDTITVSRPAAGTAHSITGKVVKGNGSANVAETGSPASPITVTLDTTSGSVTSPCSAQVGDSDVYAWYYSCTVSNGWTGTLTFGSTGSVYTFDDATSNSLTTSPMTVTSATTVDPVIAFGDTVTLTGQVTKANVPNSSPQPDITATNTTITFSGTASGTCTNKAVTGAGSNERLVYSCVVPKGWTGAITITVDPTGGAYTYLSPGSTPCTGSTTGSCTLAPVTSALLDVDGTSSSATLLQKQQTNVEARR